jgi:hypothetical protein
LDFIKDLYEARLTRDANNVRNLTYTDCCERTYLTLLILELARKIPGQESWVREYADRTLTTAGFKTFLPSRSDLHNLVYFIIGDEDALGKLKDPGAARKLQKNTFFPLNSFERYIRNIKTGTTPSVVSEFFIKIENKLHITNSEYKATRRGVLNFERLDFKSKQNVVTRLLIAARAKLRTSDIIDNFSELSAENSFETGRIKDNEPKVSVPDITVDSKTLALYRYLVGTDNLALTKRFVELAKNGQSIPSNAVQAYMPIIKMIDDIVNGGPQYVQLLRNIHKKSKK